MSEQEMIARIIDPDAFKNRETLANYCIGQGDSTEVAHEYAEQTHGPDCAAALAKAAAILTTLASRTPEGERRVRCSKCGEQIGRAHV